MKAMSHHALCIQVCASVVLSTKIAAAKSYHKRFVLYSMCLFSVIKSWIIFLLSMISCFHEQLCRFLLCNGAGFMGTNQQRMRCWLAIVPYVNCLLSRGATGVYSGCQRKWLPGTIALALTFNWTVHTELYGHLQRVDWLKLFAFRKVNTTSNHINPCYALDLAQFSVCTMSKFEVHCRKIGPSWQHLYIKLKMVSLHICLTVSKSWYKMH